MALPSATVLDIVPETSVTVARMAVVPVAVVEIMASDVIIEDIGDSAIVSIVMASVVAMWIGIISVVFAAVVVERTSVAVAGDPVVIAKMDVKWF